MRAASDNIKMADIRRINKLKKMSLRLAEQVRETDPLQSFGRSSVTDTGMTYDDLREKLEKISSCASVIELKESWTGTPDNLEQVFEISAANYCKQHVLCPVCADRMQARRKARFDNSIREQSQLVEQTAARIDGGTFVENDSDNRFAYIVTYTVTDGKNLSDRLEHLKESKKAFRRMGQKRSFGRSAGESGKIKAAISTIEIKRGTGSGEWHAHSHDLVFTDRRFDFEVYDREARRRLREQYGREIPKDKLTEIALHPVEFRGEIVPSSKLSREWLSATGGDSIGIRIDEMRHVPKTKTVFQGGVLKTERISESKRKKLMAMSFADSILYQSKEVLKYPYKPGELEPWDSVQVLSATYNKRMTATYGQFRGVAGDDYVDPAHPEQETYVLVWSPDSGRYGDPQPGKLRDIVGDDAEHEARSLSGKATGEYRRHRKYLMESRTTYGIDLAASLDASKAAYRSRVRSIWANYRHRIDSLKRTNAAGCDKYCAVLSPAGSWFPAADRRDLIEKAWS